MQISPSKFTAALVAILSVALLGWSFYFLYGIFAAGVINQSSASIETLNVSILEGKLQKSGSALTGSGKVSLKKKDIAFTESALYKSFTDIPDGVPLSDSRGRADPFVPYVAP